jgi:hypothetical protein
MGYACREKGVRSKTGGAADGTGCADLRGSRSYYIEESGADFRSRRNRKPREHIRFLLSAVSLKNLRGCRFPVLPGGAYRHEPLFFIKTAFLFLFFVVWCR